MIVRISIFDTIINLHKPYIMVNCIKIVSKIHFLTFNDSAKINKGLSLCDLALYLSCLGRWITIPSISSVTIRNLGQGLFSKNAQITAH